MEGSSRASAGVSSWKGKTRALTIMRRFKTWKLGGYQWVALVFYLCISIADARAALFKVEREGEILHKLRETDPDRQDQTERERTWLAFQEFARSHEDEKYRKGAVRSHGSGTNSKSKSEVHDSCGNIGLDDKGYLHKHVDRSTSGPKLPKRILFLTTVQALFMMTDRWSFHFYLALASKRLNYHVVLWGIGLPGFNTNETLNANINRWFLDPRLDVVITTWNFHRTFVGHDTWKDWRFSSSSLAQIHERLDKDRRRNITRPLSALDSSILSTSRRSLEFYKVLPGDPVVVVLYHEIEKYEKRDLFEIKPHIVIVQYEQQLGVTRSRQTDLCGNPVTKTDGCYMHPVLKKYMTEYPRHAMLAYVPHGVHGPLFFDDGERDPCDKETKNTDSLIIGAIHNQFYPLRSDAFAAMRGYTKVISIHRHPGYKEEIEWYTTLEEMCRNYFEEGPYQKHRAYVNHMKSSRFCILGGRNINLGYEGACRIFVWPLRKYVEAMAAGCIVVGDIASDKTIAQFMAKRLTSQRPIALADSLEALVSSYKNLSTPFQNRFCQPARKRMKLNFTYSALVDTHFTPALNAYFRSVRGVFADTLSEKLVTNDVCDWTKSTADSVARILYSS